MTEVKDLLAKYKHLIHLYIHKDENRQQYEDLLRELNMTDEKVSVAIERCKGEPEFRALAKYSLLFTDFFDNAPEEDQQKVSLILLLAIIAMNYDEKHN